jgi:mitochondrial fission protein ELM1
MTAPSATHTPSSWLLSAGFVGLENQALGLADAAGLSPDIRVLHPRLPWKYLTAGLWPKPLTAIEREALNGPAPGLVISAGGMAAPVGAALRGPGTRVVHVQHPRIDPRRFDLIVVNRHDGLTGPNVIVTRTALHRVTEARLAEAAVQWGPRLAHLPRPLVAVLVGGPNGRYRLDAPVATALAAQLVEMMRRDGAGVAVTPSRRTPPPVIRALSDGLTRHGGWVWDFSGDNPYFGLLALADAVVVTQESVSMISEAVATHSPVMLAELPGGSRRQGLFTDGLLADGRVRRFRGRLEHWPVEPMDETGRAGAEVRQRLGF